MHNPVRKEPFVGPKPSRKPTILIIGPTPPPYIGPSVATKMIIDSELKDSFHLLHLDTSDRRSLANIGKVDFRNICLALVHFLKLVAYLIGFSPRIVYLPICQTIRGYLRDVAFMAVSKIFGARIVIHLRGGYFGELYEKSNILVKFVIKYSCGFVSQAIVLGGSLRYIFEGLISPERIAVVPNGIDSAYITNRDFEKRMINRKSFRILFLSNLMYSKGFFDVIKAIPIMAQLHNDIMANVVFMFAGEFWEAEDKKQEVSQYIDKSNLNSYIKFIGTAVGDRKKGILLSSDIFVLPTYYINEGQPWVIVEAMAAGLPIITTDQGCIKEMVVDGKNGFIVEKQNPKHIAEKIVQLLINRDLREKMSTKSRERFLKYYTKDKFINRLQAVFESCID